MGALSFKGGGALSTGSIAYGLTRGLDDDREIQERTKENDELREMRRKRFEQEEAEAPLRRRALQTQVEAGESALAENRVGAPLRLQNLNNQVAIGEQNLEQGKFTFDRVKKAASREEQLQVMQDAWKGMVPAIYSGQWDIVAQKMADIDPGEATFTAEASPDGNVVTFKGSDGRVMKFDGTKPMDIMGVKIPPGNVRKQIFMLGQIKMDPENLNRMLDAQAAQQEKALERQDKAAERADKNHEKAGPLEKNITFLRGLKTTDGKPLFDDSKVAAFIESYMSKGSAPTDEELRFGLEKAIAPSAALMEPEEISDLVDQAFWRIKGGKAKGIEPPKRSTKPLPMKGGKISDNTTDYEHDEVYQLPDRSNKAALVNGVKYQTKFGVASWDKSKNSWVLLEPVKKAPKTEGK